MISQIRCTSPAVRLNNGKGAVAKRLRRKIDASDSFTTGHQIIVVRSKERIDPEWSKSDEEIRKILLRTFPSLDSNARQRASAGRWMRVIQLYYRKHMTEGQIAGEIGVSVRTVNQLIYRINRAGRGERGSIGRHYKKTTA